MSQRINTYVLCTPNVTSQVSTGSLMCASAPSVFEQVPTSSVISGSGVFQQVPPGSVTSAQSDFQHVPTGSVTSAPNDFRHVLPDSVTSAPIVFQQVPTGSVTSAPVVFQRVPPGSVTSAQSDFQHAPPGSVTSAPNVSRHVPPGSVTSAPSDFQHAPPSYVTSAPIVFQQVPTGSVTSAPVVFQRVPPGSVTSASSDFQHAPPGSVTSAPNVSRHVPPGSVTSAPSDFQHALPGYVTSAPNVFQQALSGHVTSAPNLFQQVSPGSVISAPNVFQQVPTGYVTSAPNVSQQVPVGYVTNAPDASRHVHPGSVISAPNVSQHVPPGSMTPAPNGSHLVLTGSVSSATSVSGFETSGPSDFQHVPPGSMTSAPNVCQHVPPGPLTSSPNVCQHVPPGSMTSAPNVSQHVPAGSMTSAPNVSQQVLAGSPMSSPSVSPRVLSGPSTSINVHQHSSVVSSKEDQDPFILVSRRLSHQKSVVQHFGIEAHFSNNLFCLLPHEELKESHISDTRKVNGKKCTGKSHVSRSKRKCYRIKVFGKDTELFSESKHITHSIVKQHVKDLTSKKAVRNCIIICNGKVNCDKIFPNDNITVCPGLQGGGRQRELHGGAPCMSCFICKKAAAYTGEKYTHLIRKQKKADGIPFVDFVKSKYSNIKDDSCICRGCEQKIQRELKSSSQELGPPPSKRPRTECVAKEHLGFSDCDGNVVSTDWDLETVVEGLMYQHDIMCDNEDKVSLCKIHYHRVYDSLKCRNFINCCSCQRGIGPKRTCRKYACNFPGCDKDLYELLSSLASEFFQRTVTITKDSQFCGDCYDPFLNIIVKNKKVFQNPAIHQPILLDIMAEYTADVDMNSCPDSETIEEAAFNSTVNHVAQMFYDKRVVLLKDLYLYYTERAEQFGLLEYDDEIIYQATLKTKKSFLISLQTIFEKAV